MKKGHFILVIGVLFVISALMVAGCGKNGGSSSGSGDSDNVFFSSAKQVAPAISAGSGSGAVMAFAGSELTQGTILYDINYLLKDYEYPRDEGVIDMHNIYKVLYSSGQIFENAEGSCTTISESAVSSPYDLGLSGQTYNCAGNSGTMTDNYANGFAIKTSGDVKYGLLTYRWAPESPSHEEHGVLQGSYDESSGNLTLHMIHHVYYASQEGFVVRSHITGNADTHSFTLKSISSGTSGGTWISIVGKGVSRGSGNYFLFKVKNSAGVTDKYFCFPASATEDTLALMHESAPTGSASVDAECASYQADVDAMTFLTTSDVPMSISDFTSSSILLSY